MLYRNKTPYGEKLIEVTEILPETIHGKSAYDRVFYKAATVKEGFIYAGAFECDYEPVPDGEAVCPCCGAVINE